MLRSPLKPGLPPSTSGGSGALNHESCCPHPMVAMSLLGLGGGAPLAGRRRPLTGRTRMLATKTRQREEAEAMHY